jgi:hypothetical protein
MSQVQSQVRVSLAEAHNLIATCGAEVTIMLQGGMGIGKSSLLWGLAEQFRDTHDAVYMDMTTKDIADLSGVPYIEERNGIKVTHFAPNSELKLHNKKPIILMLDEFGKAMRPVQNTALRLMLERKMGEDALPAGSIVFGTTNKTGEGLGDNIQPHARNRISFVTVESPDHEQWCEWAVSNGVEAEVIAWVSQNPQCLASFDDGGQEDNHYIYHPNKPAMAFCTPRSLTKASSIIKHRGTLGTNATIAGVSGCVGESAARDMMAYAALADKLPTWDSIVRNPETAKLPADGDAAASFITIYSALARVDKASFDPWMVYCQRMAKEFQAVFCLNVVKAPARSFALANRSFVLWATQNHWMLDGK